MNSARRASSLPTPSSFVGLLAVLVASSAGLPVRCSATPRPAAALVVSALMTPGRDDATTAAQDWDAQRYQKQYSFVWEYGSSLVDVLDPKPGERILDVGCGTGELTKAIGDRGATGIGFDADADMVERAIAQFPDQRFFQAYAQSFQLEDGPVDAVFSNAALHWVKDAEGAVVAMSKALKPGGRFVVEFGGKGNVQRITDAIEDITGSSDNPWYFPSIAEYTQLLERHGIEVTSAALFDRPTPLNGGEEGMSNWIRMFGAAFWKHLDEDTFDRMLRHVNDKLRGQLYDGEKWIADYRRIRIVGRKLEPADGL